jgi:hypothetical protein
MTARIFEVIKAATPKQQAVLDALREAGWVFSFQRFPGTSTFDHPANGTEMPTPDYVTKSMWPGETYTALHQLTIMWDVVARDHETGTNTIKITHIFKREAPAPWVGARESDIGLGKAIEWVRGPHPAAEVSTGDQREV